MLTYLHYKDVFLLPKLSPLESRLHADTTVVLGKHRFNTPAIPANMECTIDMTLAEQLSRNGHFYIMHRFRNNPVELVKEMIRLQLPVVSISLGVKSMTPEILEELSQYRIDYITIDIAHGHSNICASVLKMIRKYLPKVYVIAGNVATIEGARFLQDNGTHAIKVGIGQGLVCTTKDKTGFTCPMFSCVKDIAAHSNIPIIADGGIRSHGDIAKALVAGATMVMCGSLFARCVDSPAETLKTNQHTHKVYYGSASKRSDNKTNNIEGTTEILECSDETYIQKFKTIKEDLQSAISYAGGRNLSALISANYGVQHA